MELVAIGWLLPSSVSCYKPSHAWKQDKAIGLGVYMYICDPFGENLLKRSETSIEI